MRHHLQPLTPPPLAEAAKRGNPTINVLGMLLRPAFQRWFGVLQDATAELRAAVEATIG